MYHNVTQTLSSNTVTNSPYYLAPNTTSIHTHITNQTDIMDQSVNLYHNVTETLSNTTVTSSPFLTSTNTSSPNTTQMDAVLQTRMVVCNAIHRSNHWDDSLYHYILQVVFPILIVIGVLINIVILVVLSRQPLRDKYRWLRALALADLLLCLLTIPISFIGGGQERGRSLNTANYYAHFGWSLNAIAEVVGFYLVAWFAFDHFVAKCRSQKYSLCQKPKEFYRRVVVTTACVVILYIPTMTAGYVEDCSDGWVPVDGYSEVLSEGWYNSYVVMREVLSRLCPGLIITFCNVSLIIILRKPNVVSSKCSEARSKDLRLLVLLGCITICFYLFNVPFMLKMFYGDHNLMQDEMNSDTLSALSNLVKMLGNVCNFALYFIVTPDFRQTMTELVCACELKTGNTSRPQDQIITLRTTITTTTTQNAFRDSNPESVTSNVQESNNRVDVV